MDRLITEQVQRISDNSKAQWEKTLKLYMKPKPQYMPVSVWKRIVGMVLYQTETLWNKP